MRVKNKSDRYCMWKERGSVCMKSRSVCYRKKNNQSGIIFAFQINWPSPLLLGSVGATSNNARLASSGGAQQSIAATHQPRNLQTYFSQTTAVWAWLKTVVLHKSDPFRASLTWWGIQGTSHPWRSCWEPGQDASACASEPLPRH